MDLVDQAEKEGFDIPAALASNGGYPSKATRAQTLTPRTEAQELKAQDDMLKLCQKAMDTCYDWY